MDLDGKVTIITGGASGIGKACAQAFAERGAKLVLADLDEAAAAGVAEPLGGIGVHCDVGRADEIDALVARAEADFGPVDIFFSNAGIATGSDPLATDIAVWDEQWQVNLMAHVYAVRAVLPAMLSRGSGYLIHTASMAGILTSHGNLPYAVTKHAVDGLAEWLSVTYHDQGVRVSLLAPLGVRTPMLGDPNSSFARNAAGPIKEPEEVARMMVEAVEAERFLILTDPIAQTWMEMKTTNLERWLTGMRRLQAKIADQPEP